jgi:phosphoribosylamine--glycine ligase
VVAASGYPATPALGDPVGGIAAAGRVPGAYVLHAGTVRDRDGELVSAGGRVLDVVGAGRDISSARAAAYAAAGAITLAGGWYRTDIAAHPDQPGGDEAPAGGTAG